ncbi:hypothetical protein CS022_20155 [Veronia nyctiphanis]|uniref:PepSY domain-containing protein n=1 Tax=Veronia nyctiphanis TaxID=1278244 RepID=A0A4Q0YLM2_9GAMM|nr:PepSY-associated TM helix domain-containing protein [Veronia nyctiphanis]RXJ71660.1 hypothetical protein CS022_20155 [Veronia nyctiphanis]
MRKITDFFRWSHKWIALVIAIYFIFKIATGIFLQLRKPVDWIQPPTLNGVGFKEYNPTISHDRILAAVKSVPEANVDTWSDILLLDMRMKNGIVKARTYDWYEVQVDTQTGEVLSHNQRWNDRIGGWHSGSAFGEATLIFFLILAILTFFLTVSGAWLSVTTTIEKVKNYKRRKIAEKIIAENMQDTVKTKAPFNLMRFCLDYHFYLSLIVAIPYLVVTYSGVMLQWRDVQGAYPGAAGGSLASVTGSSTIPTVTYNEAIKIALDNSEFGISKPKHIWRVYTYPNEGIISLRTKRYVGTRAQIDAATGEVLNVGEFTSDFWEDIHQGRFYEVTGNPNSKGYDYSLTLNIFMFVHIVAIIFWLLGTVAVIKLTITDRKRVST